MKRYGNHIAVDHLDFTIKKGRIYGFLGPNGAGKSTTMNIMTGYLGATEGEVLINGHNILTEPGKAKKDIGYLPELPPLYIDMTVLEYLKFVFALKKVPPAKVGGQMAQILNMVKLTDVKSRLIKNLSKGYKQRVGLAAALAGFPKMLVLDEPTVGLDPQQIIEIRSLIRELSKDHTILLSSHILSEVQELCDHILIIYKGKLVASDTPERLMRQLSGDSSLELVVKGSMEQVQKTTDSLSFVHSCTLAPCTSAGEPLSHEEKQEADTGVSEPYVRLFLSADNSADVREKLFWAFAGQKLPILSMSGKRTTLEDIFLELTSSKEAAGEIATNAAGTDTDSDSDELPGEFDEIEDKTDDAADSEEGM